MSTTYALCLRAVIPRAIALVPVLTRMLNPATPENPRLWMHYAKRSSVSSRSSRLVLSPKTCTVIADAVVYVRPMSIA
jgi:hypothetical protein